MKKYASQEIIDGVVNKSGKSKKHGGNTEEKNNEDKGSDGSLS